MDAEARTMKVAWGITGSGDDLKQILGTMKRVKETHNEVEIRVYVSKSGEQVLRMYFLWDDLMESFSKILVEKSSNVPFLAGELQSGKYDFLVIAPTTSNTTAKIALGIGDSMISNAVNMATKAGIPVYLLPCEVGEGSTTTTLPNGRVLNLRIRDIDTQHIRKLKEMNGVDVIESPNQISEIFAKHYI